MPAEAGNRKASAMTTTTVDEILEMHDRIRTGEARRLRTSARLSMNALASALDVTPAAIMRWEIGRSLPSGANALRYARMLQKLAARA